MSVETSPTLGYIPDNLPDRIQHFIDGEFVDSLGGETFDVLDPVSNQTYATAAAGRRKTSTCAVAAPRSAPSTTAPGRRLCPASAARAS